MTGGGGGAEESGSGRKQNAFGETLPQDVTLNLTALMDILSNLLFFLLASFGATIVMSINGAVPVQSAEKSDAADTSKSVTVNIKITQKTLEIAATGLAQTEAELDALTRKLSYSIEGFDPKPIREYLLYVKGKYPTSDTVILTPETGVQYQTMIKIMDAARESELRAGGKVRMVKLFPTVVVSTLVK